MKIEFKKQNGFSNIIIISILFIVIIGIVFVLFVLNNNNNKNKEVGLNEDILIGFSITTLKEERWQKDKEEFLAKAEELGVTVDLQVAQNDSQKQAMQIEEMIINGVDVIVVVPYQADTLSDVIEKAHQAGIKVISYDRLIKNSNTDLYISFDNEKVGEYQAEYVIRELKDKIESGLKPKIAYVGGAERDNNAFLLKDGSMKILKPLIDENKIEIVYDKFTTDWNLDFVFTNLKEYLSKSGGKIDGVIAANDGTALGAIMALREYGLDGKIPVSGQDAELAAIQRIILGTQTITVYKPVKDLASSAVEMAVLMAKGINIESNGIINDGKYDVPAYLIEPTVITKDNIEDTIIKDGYHKKDDVYRKF